MLKPGDVILARMQYVDSFESKVRPALVLFEELDNVVIAGITTNLKMKGIPISKAEGAAQDSVIKLNYIFTISSKTLMKRLFHLTKEKKNIIYDELISHFSDLKV